VLPSGEPDEVEHLGDLGSHPFRGRPITSRTKATFSATVLFGRRRKSWNTHPRLRRRYGTRHCVNSPISRPATQILPSSGSSSRRRRRRQVVFPEPEGTNEKDEIAPGDLHGDIPKRRHRTFVNLSDVVEESSSWFLGAPGPQEEGRFSRRFGDHVVLTGATNSRKNSLRCGCHTAISEEPNRLAIAPKTWLLTGLGAIIGEVAPHRSAANAGRRQESRRSPRRGPRRRYRSPPGPKILDELVRRVT